MNDTCLIISGGDFVKYKQDMSFDMIIACDKGLKYADMLGLKPDYFIGDLDSLDQKSLGISKKYPDMQTIKLDPEKDDPDTMSAIRFALQHGVSNITVICCMGGRFDHALGNIQAGAFFASYGGFVRLIGQDEYICIFSGPNERGVLHTFVEYSDGSHKYSGPRSYRIDCAGTDHPQDQKTNADTDKDTYKYAYTDSGEDITSVVIPRFNGWSLSVISISDKCTGVDIKGAKYNLTDSELSNRMPLGISNEWASDEVTVSIKNGILMVVCSRMP